MGEFPRGRRDVGPGVRPRRENLFKMLCSSLLFRFFLEDFGAVGFSWLSAFGGVRGSRTWLESFQAGCGRGWLNEGSLSVPAYSVPKAPLHPQASGPTCSRSHHFDRADGTEILQPEQASGRESATPPDALGSPGVLSRGLDSLRTTSPCRASPLMGRSLGRVVGTEITPPPPPATRHRLNGVRGNSTAVGASPRNPLQRA